MIDLHLHLLPGIDDGASNLDVSRAMLERLSAAGYTRAVATPHLMQPLTDDYETQARAGLDLVRPLAAEVGINLDLGYEHQLTPGLADRLRAGESSTLGGSRAVLVELPFIGWPQHAESSLFALQMAGYIPVLAHPERYVGVQDDPELALAVAGRGVVLQLTVASFVGVFGKQVQRVARELLRESMDRGLAVVLATDAHSDGQRLSQVDSGLDWIRKRIASGEAVIEWAAKGVPAALLADAPLPLLDPAARVPNDTGRSFSRMVKGLFRAGDRVS